MELSPLSLVRPQVFWWTDAIYLILAAAAEISLAVWHWMVANKQSSATRSTGKLHSSLNIESRKSLAISALFTPFPSSTGGHNQQVFHNISLAQFTLPWLESYWWLREKRGSQAILLDGKSSQWSEWSLWPQYTMHKTRQWTQQYGKQWHININVGCGGAHKFRSFIRVQSGGWLSVDHHDQPFWSRRPWKPSGTPSITTFKRSVHSYFGISVYPKVGVQGWNWSNFLSLIEL